MDRIVLSCEGTSIGSIRVPPFELRAGGYLCLHMPCLAYSRAEDEVIQALVGKRLVVGLRPFGPIRLASPPVQRSGLLGLFYRPRALDWLRQTAGVTADEAAAAIARVRNLTDERVARCRIESIPWTARVLLGLEAAWATRPDAVVFTTVGQDPLGVQTVFQAVASRLADSAGINLSHEYFTEGRGERTCPRGAACVELRDDSKMSATLSSA